ncbi:MAG: hypothetical protein OXG84_04055 [Chloroflexi bacterium]|nr:hypothetical protein [Chloroflexota bacterium]
MAISEPTSQVTAQAEETRESMPVGERVARLEGAYEHLSTKADVGSVRTEVEKVRTEVESVRTEVESGRTEVESLRSETNEKFGRLSSEIATLKADIRSTRWMIGVLIAAASVGVAVVNVLVTLALRT